MKTTKTTPTKSFSSTALSSTLASTRRAFGRGVYIMYSKDLAVHYNAVQRLYEDYKDWIDSLTLLDKMLMFAQASSYFKTELLDCFAADRVEIVGYDKVFLDSEIRFDKYDVYLIDDYGIKQIELEDGAREYWVEEKVLEDIF
ncbi:hypothetical protein NHG29_09170 [Aerococcaceae bacterium NML160702]|nr:hypothetical protein [Aerococcaceae bacterium NML160702]